MPTTITFDFTTSMDPVDWDLAVEKAEDDETKSAQKTLRAYRYSTLSKIFGLSTTDPDEIKQQIIEGGHDFLFKPTRGAKALKDSKRKTLT